MSKRQLAILKYLVDDINAEVGCWEQAIECFSAATNNETLLEKIKLLESKAREYKNFVKNIQILFEI